jgi:hypothetical protein
MPPEVASGAFDGAAQHRTSRSGAPCIVSTPASAHHHHHRQHHHLQLWADLACCAAAGSWRRAAPASPLRTASRRTSWPSWSSAGGQHIAALASNRQAGLAPATRWLVHRLRSQQQHVTSTPAAAVISAFTPLLRPAPPPLPPPAAQTRGSLGPYCCHAGRCRGRARPACMATSPWLPASSRWS